MSNMEQFEAVLENFPTADKNKLAKLLNVELPESIPTLDEQLNNVTVVKHTNKQSKKNPNPTEAEYVTVPSLQLDAHTGARGFWVRADVARQVANKILAVLDAAGK